MALTWTTAGESHGPVLVGILSGFPADFELSLERVQSELARRQGGAGRSGRMKIECDRAEVLSGLRAGRTLGSPIALSIANRDATLERLPVPGNARPGHADLAGCQRLWLRDPRAVLERASARETAMRVALGAVARQLLERFGVEIFAHVVELGGCAVDTGAVESVCGDDAPGAREARLARRAASPFYTLDERADAAMAERLESARAAGDTLGGVFEVRASGLPPGLGSYQDPRERLTARLGAALLSIPAIKGVEFGLGFAAARTAGAHAHDEIVPAQGAASGGSAAWGRFARATNRAGGLEGGMTTGETVLARAAMKPIPTLRAGLSSVDFASGAAVRATYQRSDVTAVPAASVVGEAVVALELARAFSERFAGAARAQVEEAFEAHRRALARL